MANIYPDQLRTVDPYSEYNSNVVNRLTRIVTSGRNCLRNLPALQVTRVDESTVQISTGMCFKDDVVIEIENVFDVDLTDLDFYIEGGPAFDETGYYFVLLNYIYEKAKPAPRAAVSILKPSQLSAYDTSYLFLACLDVETNPSPPPGQRIKPVSGVLSYYPTDPTIHREYAPFFIGVYETLPPWSIEREGELIYVIDEARLYFASETTWIKIPKKFTHVQAAPSATWTITHNLADQYINVSVFNSSWQEIFPTSVTSTNINTCTVVFNRVIAGFATISA
jgi:hypothetical protein